MCSLLTALRNIVRHLTPLLPARAGTNHATADRQ